MFVFWWLFDFYWYSVRGSVIMYFILIMVYCIFLVIKFFFFRFEVIVIWVEFFCNKEDFVFGEI